MRNRIYNLKSNFIKSLPNKEHCQINVEDSPKYTIMIVIACLILLSSFLFNTPYEILKGMKIIILSPSILITDYMKIANIGAAFFNSGINTLLGIYMARANKINMNGPLMAALFTIAGFSFFGKNLYNTIGIMFGVFAYSKYIKESFNKYILIAFFGTGLGPLTSLVTFGLDIPYIISVPLGSLAGIIAGFILVPLANHFIKFHMGFNLYNVGFTVGIIGTFFMAIIRGLGFKSLHVDQILYGNNKILSIYLFILFTMLLIIGLSYNGFSFRGVRSLFKSTGRLVSDFISSTGFGVVLINMALLGYLSLFYVLIVDGELNGPILGGIFTIVGFGAYGKHIRNVLPILIGVYMASVLNIVDTHSTGALLAALFGTTLAPIAGYFGAIPGIIAGFLHMYMSSNVVYLHGGMNLYNNGFSGGFIAAGLVPIFEVLKIKEIREKWEFGKLKK